MILNHKNFKIIDQTEFDLMILGGGINGVSIQKEASSRGYKSILIDNYDFGRGASSHSSRLIHGGLRYLEYFEFGLVYESLSSRSYLLKNFAHLVKPINLNIPVFLNRGRPKWMIKAGMILYDLLSIRKNLPNHQKVSKQKLKENFPDLNEENLKCAYNYYDAQIEWPERLIFQLLNSVNPDSLSCNHTNIEKYESVQGMHNFFLKSNTNGQTALVKSKMIINATGAWVDLANENLSKKTTHIGGTKGSHIVYSSQITPKTSALYVEAKQDGRPFFILPWNDMTLIGTTDLHYHDSLDKIVISKDEVDYIEKELSVLFRDFKKEKVHYTFSSIRPLPKVDPENSTAKITRKHTFNWLNKDQSMVDVIGGKLTTFPKLSSELMNKIDAHFSRKTKKKSFFGMDKPFINNLENLKTAYRRLFLQYEVYLSESECDKLVSFYGTDLLEFCNLNETITSSDFKKIHPDLSQFVLEFKYCFDQESILTWSDFFERRTDISAKIGSNKTLWLELKNNLDLLNLKIDSAGFDFDNFLSNFFEIKFSFQQSN